MLEIPYTGSDPLTLGLCLDKRRTKEVLRCNGVPTPTVFGSSPALAEIPPRLRYPLMVNRPSKIEQGGHRSLSGPQPQGTAAPSRVGIEQLPPTGTA